MRPGSGNIDVSNSSFVQFQIWDFPGQIDFFDSTFDAEAIFAGSSALVFVIDAQNDYDEALAKLRATVIRANEVNPSIKFEVFIHKVDGLLDDQKLGSLSPSPFLLSLFSYSSTFPSPPLPSPAPLPSLLPPSFLSPFTSSFPAPWLLFLLHDHSSSYLPISGFPSPLFSPLPFILVSFIFSSSFGCSSSVLFLLGCSSSFHSLP